MTAKAYSVSTPASVVGVSFRCKASHCTANVSSADSRSDGRAGSGDDEPVETADGTRAALAAQQRWRGAAAELGAVRGALVLPKWTAAASSAAGCVQSPTRRMSPHTARVMRRSAGWWRVALLLFPMTWTDTLFINTVFAECCEHDN